jgi:outer membrane receptor for ferrienterochelin and colicins
MKRLVSLAWILVSAISLGGVARADDASEAKLQFDLGQELYKRKRFPEAVDHFIASNRLVPNANVVFNIANICRLMATTEQKKREIANADEHLLEAYNWTETYLAFALSDVERGDGLRLRDALKPGVAIVDVMSTPAGAEIFVDREDLGAVGHAPLHVAVAPGHRTIILRMRGYREAHAEEAVRVGETSVVRLALERITGILRVTSVPPGARVTVEGTNEELGATPLERPLAVGPHRIVVSLEGYVDVTRELIVGEAAPTTLAATLQRAAESVATLSVTGTPAQAVVRLDGRPVGELPTSLTGLSPGKGLLEILAPGQQPWSSEIPLEGGAATRIAVRLAPEEKQAWAGWKWLGFAGGGAVLASGAVVGLVAKNTAGDYWNNPSRQLYDRTGRLDLTADVLMSVGAAAVLTTAMVHWLWPTPIASHADVTVVR